MKKVNIYTDGACSGNPGKGGAGAVLMYNDFKKELSEGFYKTTNNRMEIYAVIMALRILKEPCEIMLYSDSRYVVDAINKGWVLKWKKNNWMRTKTDKALNIDLWEELLELLNVHKVTFNWVKGHASNPWNNRCDELATGAIKGTNLKEDKNYK
ncbi:MAG: ribonuclease HI [Clostridiales bacterium]|nr:ribonuclease HI [Clostridiales bacterium]